MSPVLRTVVATAVVFSPTLAGAQEVFPVRDPPSCACQLRVTHAFTIADPTGRAGLSSPVSITRTSDGRILVVASVSQGQVLVFDSTGSFARRIGRTGRGPREYLAILDLVPGPSDSVFVLDTNNARVAVLTPGSLVEARTVQLPGFHFQLGITSDRHVVTNGADEAELVHVFTPDMEPIRTLVPVPVRGEDARRGEERRRIAVSRSGEIAVAHFNDYRIEVWDLSGTHLRTLEREAAWFPAGGEAGSRSADRQARPNAGLWTPRFDEHGRLWTLAHVADEDWADALETVSDPYGRPRMGVPQGSQSDLYDSVIEVLDPGTGKLLASTRIDAALGFLLPGGYAASYREDDGGNPFIDIWRIEVVEASVGGDLPG